jgi:putative proteasome-type protease
VTYCVGLLLDAGIVMLSDTRTNAGFDNISVYRKMFVFEDPGERVLVLMTSGNLSVTQTVLGRLSQAIENPTPPTRPRSCWPRPCSMPPRWSGARCTRSAPP